MNTLDYQQLSTLMQKPANLYLLFSLYDMHNKYTNDTKAGLFSRYIFFIKRLVLLPVVICCHISTLSL
jgi:hypothetical protein